MQLVIEVCQLIYIVRSMVLVTYTRDYGEYIHTPTFNISTIPQKLNVGKTVRNNSCVVL